MEQRSHHIIGTSLLVGVAVAVFVALVVVFLGTPSGGSQVAQTGGALTDVSASARVSGEIDCETGAITHVYFDVLPKEGAEITIIDHGQVRRFDHLGSYEEAGLDGYFVNGMYEGVVTARAGYTLRTSSVITFTVASVCGNVADPLAPLPVSQPTSTPPVPTPLLPDSSPEAEKSPAPVVAPSSPVPTTSSAPTPLSQPTPPVPQTTEALIPVATCGSAEACAEICAEKGGTKVCAEFAAAAVVPAPLSSIATEKLDNTFREATMDTFIGERSGVRAYADSDQDGVVDFDEVNIYGTDPDSADSDKDGVTDGLELLANTDPVGGAGVEGKVTVFEDPARFGKEATTTLVVATVVAGAALSDASGVSHLSSVTLSGTGFPNSFVTIFVYSDPVVVTVKTDDFGAWTYTLDKELPDGSHEVYAAVADAKGRVWARSAPLPFVQTASAISVGSTALLPSNPEAPSFFAGSGALVALGAILLVLVASVFVFGYIRAGREVHR